MKLYFQLFFLFSSLSFAKAQDCGDKRWDIKTLSDVDTNNINFINPVRSSVHIQTHLQRPSGILSSRTSSEDTVYSITCYIIAYKKKLDDKDIHIIIRDVNTKETMVAEISSADCNNIKNTSRFQQIKNLDEWFEKNIGVPKENFTFPWKAKLVTITGVGIFDTVHGQKGMAKNGREIHPVLTIKIEPTKK